MTAPLVTSLYAAVLCVVFVTLASRVIRARRAARIPVGTGEDVRLLRASRVHANFAEYVPFALLLMALAEMNGAWPLFIHGIGVALVAGRSLHAFGVSQPSENFRFRVGGMALTFAALVSAATATFVVAVYRLLVA